MLHITKTQKGVGFSLSLQTLKCRNSTIKLVKTAIKSSTVAHDVQKNRDFFSALMKPLLGDIRFERTVVVHLALIRTYYSESDRLIKNKETF